MNTAKISDLPNGTTIDPSKDLIEVSQSTSTGYVSIKAPAGQIGATAFADKGTATLITGTKTVNSTKIKANSIILVSYNTVSINPDPGSGTSVLAVPIGSFIVGTSFVINAYKTGGGTSINTSDVSTVNWVMINP